MDKALLGRGSPSRHRERPPSVLNPAQAPVPLGGLGGGLSLIQCLLGPRPEPRGRRGVPGGKGGSQASPRVMDLPSPAPPYSPTHLQDLVPEHRQLVGVAGGEVVENLDVLGHGRRGFVAPARSRGLRRGPGPRVSWLGRGRGSSGRAVPPALAQAAVRAEPLAAGNGNCDSPEHRGGGPCGRRGCDGGRRPAGPGCLGHSKASPNPSHLRGPQARPPGHTRARRVPQK